MKKRLYMNEYDYEDGFLLNLLILADALGERYNIVQFLPRSSQPILKGIRHYRTNPSPQIGYIYLVSAADVTEQFKTYKDIHFIVIGKTQASYFPSSCPLIILEDSCDPIDVFDYTQHIFAKYNRWDLALQRALNSDTPLEDMLESSLDIFENPLFIHDTDFYILACPRYIEGMTLWEQDPRTGRNMVPLHVLNDFKIDVEYMHSLQMHHVDMFSANQRGYRILYNNLWNGSRYEGRICINELQSIIKPGDYLALQYLSKMVISCLAKRSSFWISMGHDMEESYKQILERKLSPQEIERILRLMSWNIQDTYLVVKLGMDHVDIDQRFTASALGYIETQVTASHAFFYEEGIVIIANLTKNQLSPTDVASNLSFLLREGLFKMGISNEINDFSRLPEAYKQACIALEFGGNSESMIWFFHFNEFALDYMFEKICEDLPYDFVCAKEIKALQNYDDTHNMKLNETLETYLRLERNVVQTAKALYIHRSTLFYRLERIQQIINADLDDPKVRLYLMLSYYMR